MAETEIKSINGRPIADTTARKNKADKTGWGANKYIGTDENGNLVEKDLPETGTGGITQETDPTVPSWAKQPEKPTYTKTEIGLDNVDNVRQYSTSNPPPYPVIVIPYGDTTYSFAELHEKASSGVVIGVYNSNAYTAWMYAYDNDTIRFDSYTATTRTIISYGSDGTWETRRLTSGSLVKEFYYNQNVSFDDILTEADSGDTIFLYNVPSVDGITGTTGVFAGIDNSTKTAVFIADIANGKRVICKLIDTTWSYEVEDKLTAAIIETALGYTPANANDVPAVDNTLKVTGAAADAAKVGEEISNLSTAISNLEGFVLGTANLKSWKEVQELVRAGLAPKVLKVGDQLECQRDDVKLTWDIIGFNCDTPVNPELTHSMTLQLHDGWKLLQFDTTEALYYCETELAAGTYNFTLLAGYDTTYGGGKTFSFTLSKPVPVGGVVMFPWEYQKQAAETKISTYASRESTTVLEFVSVTEGANGTSLGTADGKSANMNHTHCVRYGSNKYSTSAMRQLLNSDAAAGKVWTPQTIFDRPPTWAATQNGFLSGLDPDFLAVVADVKKRTALNTITDGGGYEDTVEKFFLLSRSEVYAGLENSVNEGNPYPYYSDFSDLSAAGSGEDGNRIKYMDGVAKYWWLRSPGASLAFNVRIVYPSGTLNNNNAHYAFACAPACTIA